MINYNYLLYMLPVMLLSLWASFRVKSAYQKYSKIPTLRGVSGRDAAKLILDSNGLGTTAVDRVPGQLTDHYNPQTNKIGLSEGVYGSSSIAAVGIAAHEAGHAVQHGTNYAFIKVRAAIIPISSIGANFSMFFIMLGILFQVLQLYWIGIILFGTVALFQLVTLPVEFDASRRAIASLESSGILNREELKGAKKVLSAAALTYVAALLTSLTQIFYYISIGNRNRK